MMNAASQNKISPLRGSSVYVYIVPQHETDRVQLALMSLPITCRSVEYTRVSKFSVSLPVWHSLAQRSGWCGAGLTVTSWSSDLPRLVNSDESMCVSCFLQTLFQCRVLLVDDSV